MNYYPNYAPGYVAPGYQQTAAAKPQTSGSLLWVQGEAGAKSYLVAPNTTVLLLDSEGDRFYLKSADASGMPLPLRVFTYREETAPATGAEKSAPGGEIPSYVTRDEFDALKTLVEGLSKQTKGKIKDE